MQLVGIPNLQRAFTSCSELVEATVGFWGHRPFQVRPAPWEGDEPELFTWLRGLSDSTIDALESDPWAVAEVPDTFHELRCQAGAVASVVSRLAGTEGPPVPAFSTLTPRIRWKIPGRKLDQIRAFSAVVLPHLKTATLVEWCAGKGHLSRVICHELGGEAVLVERDPAVIGVGKNLHARAGTRCTYCAVDVLDATASSDLDALFEPDESEVVALHACGDLTDALLRASVRRRARLVAVAPCCPHLTDGSAWSPLSSTARDRGSPLAAPELSMVGLRLSIADEPVAARRERRWRRREMLWRMGAHLLFVELGHHGAYTSLGNLETRVLRQDFDDFCRWVAGREGLEMGPDLDLRELRERAVEEVRTSRALALPRSLLRRSLELLVNLDKALFLAESGRTVRFGTFCEPTVTPRNVLMLSELP